MIWRMKLKQSSKMWLALIEREYADKELIFSTSYVTRHTACNDLGILPLISHHIIMYIQPKVKSESQNVHNAVA